MKIISGALKGRALITSNANLYRPATGRFKESLFSILSSGQFIRDGKSVLQDAMVLDLFGGTGGLAFESISRGAKSAVIVENERENHALLLKNITKLGIENVVKVINANALTIKNLSQQKVNIAFLDPPYNKQLVNPAVKNLTANNWLGPKALVVIRTHVKDTYDIDQYGIFTNLLERKSGDSLLRIYEVGA